MFDGRVFYTKETGQVFECFVNDKMKEIDSDVVEDLFFTNRKDQINYMVIADRQVQTLKQILANKSDISYPLWPKSTIEIYRLYGIISDDEYKGFINQYSQS